MQQVNRRTLKAGQEINHAACRQMDRKASRRWIIQHVGRCTEAVGQEKDRAACPQMYKGKAGDGSCSMRADGQRQGSRWIIQHAGRWTEAGQQIDHTAFRQKDRGRAPGGSYCMPADEGAGQGWTEKQDRRWNRQPADR
jgi:hypothetical protein